MPGIAEGADLGLVGFLEHGDDVGILVHRLDIGHARERTEETAEAQVLFRGQALAAEEQHEMIGEGAPYGRGVGIAQGPGQVDARDLRAQRACDRLNADRTIGHGCSLSNARLI